MLSEESIRFMENAGITLGMLLYAPKEQFENALDYLDADEVYDELRRLYLFEYRIRPLLELLEQVCLLNTGLQQKRMG